jgi:hypothetical protein
MAGGYGQTEAMAGICNLRPDEHIRRRQARRRHAPVLGRAAQPADPRRDHERRQPDPAARRDRRNLRARRPGHEGLLQGAGEDRRDHRGRLAAHRRHRPPRHRGLPAHHRSQEGHDHFRRLQRVPERSRAGDLEPPGGAGLRGDRRARRAVGRGGQGCRRAQPRPERHRRGAHRPVQGQARQRDGSQERGLHRQPAAQPGRQGAEKGPAQAVLGRRGKIARSTRG